MSVVQDTIVPYDENGGNHDPLFQQLGAVDAERVGIVRKIGVAPDRAR